MSENYIRYRGGVVNYKTLILLLILVFFFISKASAVSSNSKFDEDNNSLIIKGPAADKILLTIQQTSVRPDLVTMEEIFKITAHEDYTFQKNKDFNVRWQKYKGKNNITGLKWEILEEVEYNVTAPDYIDVEKNKTISNILTYTNITDTYDAKPWRLDWGEQRARDKWSIKSSDGDSTIGFDRFEVISTDPLSIKFLWNVTERTGSHQEAKYRDEWRPFLPDGRTINKNQSYVIKLTLYKQAETGSFSIKTIPMFAGIEEDRFTWWNGSWNYYTDNPIPNSARPYQLPLNISNSTGTNNATHVFLNGHANINFTDIRFTLDNTTLLPHWIEDNSTGRAWVNVTANGTVNLYYGNPSAVDSRDGNSTFEFFDDFTNNRFGRNPVISPTQSWESGTGDRNRWGSIALVNDKYHVYFTNHTNGLAAIGRATSTDLITWTKYANNPVIKNAIGPSLLKGLDGVTPVLYSSKYWMATMAADGTGIQIRSAANIDSDTWVVENSAALVPKTGTWYSSQVFTNSFVREGSTYYLVFQGYDGTYWRIGYATASAPGGPYTVQGILLEATQAWEGNAVIDPEVRKFGSTYYLFYTGGISPVPYNNSYATSTSLTGSYKKSLIQLTPLQHTYPAILEKDSFYYILDDDQTTTGKGLYKRADLNGGFGSPFVWDSGGSPTVSGSELLLNTDREYIRSGQTFLYKAMKVRAKYAPLSADNSYQYLGFSASSIGSDYNSEMFITTDNDLLAHSGNSGSSCDTSISTSYFGSYHNYEILWKKGEAKFFIDNVLKATHTTCIDDTSTPAGIYDYATAANFYVDWVFIRSYASPEPVWAIWTPEYPPVEPSELKLTVFAKGGDSALWYRQFDGTLWSGWQSLGGSVNNLSATSSGNSIYAFVRGGDGGLWDIKWDGSSWNNWQSLGGSVTNIDSISPDSVYAFVRGADGGLWYRKWDGSSWGSWQSLGGSIFNITSAAPGVNNLYVFVRGADGSLQYRKWDDSSWGSWQSLGGSITDLDATSSGNNVYVFTRGTNGDLWYRKWDGSSWGSWQGLGGSITRLDSVSSGNNVYAFVRGADGGLWYRKWDGSSWGSWQSLGGSITDLDATSSGNNVYVFTRGTDGDLWYRKWDGSSWGSWQSLGGSITDLDAIP